MDANMARYWQNCSETITETNKLVENFVNTLMTRKSPES